MEHGSPQVGVLLLVFLLMSLIIGVTVRTLLKRTPIPYSVSLLVIGLFLGLAEREHILVGGFQMFGASLKLVSELDPYLILFLFIPALIFESAFNMEVHLFKRTLPQTVTLAVPGLIISTILTAAFAHYVFPWEWSWPACFMFGALISATDPVAVVALLKELSSRKRLATLIEGESLLNDGTAVVFFTLFYGMVIFGAKGSTLSILGSVAGQFTWVVSLGVFIGFILGILALAWIARVFNDPLFEITISIAVAYLAYMIAEGGFHVSGIVAVVTVALLFAGRGKTMISPEVKAFLHHFWELLGYIINTLIFLWAGLVIAGKVTLTDPKIWIMLGLLYVGLQIIRAFAIGSLMPLMNRIGIGFSKNKAITLAWGGLRGAIALALALAASQDERIPEALGGQILFLAAGIVVLSILINGIGMRLVLRYCGYDRLPAAKQAVVDKAQNKIVAELKSLIPKLQMSQFFRQVDWMNVKKDVDAAAVEVAPEKKAGKDDLELAFRRRLLEAERKDYWNQFDRGLLSSDTVKALVDSVEHILDVYPSLHPRPRLQKLFCSKPFFMRFRKWSFIGRWADRRSFNKLALRYEAERGFVRAQVQIMMAYVKQLAPNKEVEQAVRKEIIANKRETLAGIELFRDEYPEMISGLETRVAKRILLNQERGEIKNMVEQGVLDEAEAEKMVEEVEHRMQRLGKTYFRLQVITPTRAQELRRVRWLSQVSEEVLNRLAGTLSERTYMPDDVITQQGVEEHSLFVITKGVAHAEQHGEIMEVLGPGSVVGERDLAPGRAREATVRAETRVETLWLAVDSVKTIAQQAPELEAALDKVVGGLKA